MANKEKLLVSRLKESRIIVVEFNCVMFNQGYIVEFLGKRTEVL